MSSTKPISLGFHICSPGARRVRSQVKQAQEPIVIDHEERLRRADALLEEWRAWSATYRPALGVPGCSPSSREAQSARQWQSTSEITEERARKSEMERVEWCVDSIAFGSRQVIGVEMRNRASRKKVWRTQSGKKYSEAIEETLPLMRLKGLLE